MNIQDKINNIENELIKKDEKFKKEKDITKIDIFTIKNLNKNLLLIKIKLDEIQLNNQMNEKDLKILENKVKYLDHNIHLLNQYINMTSDYSSSKNLDKLTILNTIFLPLGLICSYFGMNFKSMGSPTGKKGILTIKNSNYFVILLFVISIITTMFILFI